MQVRKTIILVTIFFLLPYSAWSTASIHQVKIYSDKPAFDNVGYDNCSMQTNGEELILKEVIEPAMRVFDVGANIGEWTTKVVHSFPTVQLYVFEPIPVIFDALRSNVTSGDCNFFNLAFSNMQGMQEFKYYVRHSVLSGLFERPCVTAHEAPETIQVATDTLDNFCTTHAIDSIDFLKIDTEGAEVAILQGAVHLLQNHKIKYVQFEYGGTYADAHTTLQEAYRLLSLCQYDVYRIVGNGLIHISEWRDTLENYRYSNYLAIAQQ